MPWKMTHDCGKKLAVPDGASGRTGRCPRCGKSFVVPPAPPTGSLAADPAGEPPTVRLADLLRGGPVPVAGLAPDDEDIPVAEILGDEPVYRPTGPEAARPAPPQPPSGLWGIGWPATLSLIGLALLAASGLALFRSYVDRAGRPRLPITSAALAVLCGGVTAWSRSTDRRASVPSGRTLAFATLTAIFAAKFVLAMAVIQTDNFLPPILAAVASLIPLLAGGAGAVRQSREESGRRSFLQGSVGHLARTIGLIVLAGFGLYLGFILLFAFGMRNSKFC